MALKKQTRKAAADEQIFADTYGLLFPLLFDHVGENFGTRLSLSVQQVGWHCSLGGLIIVLLLRLSLFVHFDAAKRH